MEYQGNKRKLFISALLLLAMSILAATLIYKVESDWIILIAMIIFALLSGKYWEEAAVDQWLKERFSKRTLIIISFIGMVLGYSLLPRSFGIYLTGVEKWIASMLSFLFWFLGIFIMYIARRK
jgi:small-conductance mechanosensitive channel